MSCALFCFVASKMIGSIAVAVAPINDKVPEFYLKYGFVVLPDSQKMFLPMKTIERLVGE